MTYHNGPLVDNNGVIDERALRHILKNKLYDEPDAMEWIMQGIAHLSQGAMLLPQTIGEPADERVEACLGTFTVGGKSIRRTIGA